MKEKHSSSTKTKKKYTNPEIEAFKDAAVHLVANKVFCDFMTANERFPTEPEKFFEDWLKKAVYRPDAHLKKWGWRYFMENLVGYRRFHRLQ